MTSCFIVCRAESGNGFSASCRLAPFVLQPAVGCMNTDTGVGMTERLVSTALERDAAERLAMVLGEVAWPVAQAVSLFEVDEGRGLWRVEALYEGDVPEGAALREALALAEVPADVLRREPLPEKDWVREGLKHLTAVRAGRFVVHGAHERDRVRPGEIGLEVDAGMAFGTGHHGTTQGCLMALDVLARQGVRPRRVLDVGTGTGVLAMAAARLWRVPVLATDIDAVAVAQARRNVRHNGVAPLVRVVKADGVRHPLVWRVAAPGSLRHAWPGMRKGAVSPRRGPAALRAVHLARRLSALSRGRVRELPVFADEGAGSEPLSDKGMDGRQGWDVVLANILLNPLKRMAPGIVAATAKGGHVILSGLMHDQAASALAVYRAHGLVPVRRLEVGEWSTLIMRRPG